MEKTEQSNEPCDHNFGMSSDDISVLNQVLQQVKGSSCVSCSESLHVTEQGAE